MSRCHPSRQRQDRREGALGRVSSSTNVTSISIYGDAGSSVSTAVQLYIVHCTEHVLRNNRCLSYTVPTLYNLQLCVTCVTCTTHLTCSHVHVHVYLMSCIIHVHVHVHVYGFTCTHVAYPTFNFIFPGCVSGPLLSFPAPADARARVPLPATEHCTAMEGSPSAPARCVRVSESSCFDFCRLE